MANKKFYSSVDDAIKYTGAKRQDFGFNVDKDLKEWLEDRLVEIKSLIDADRCRDYHKEVDAGLREEIPPGIHGIALRMLNNAVGHALLRRTTPIVRVDNFSIRMVEDKVFTSSIKEDLKRFPAKPDFRFMVVKKNDS